MSAAHLHAWRNRSSEHHLYLLFNYILSLNSLDFHHPNSPGDSLICCPQALFGDIPDLGAFQGGKERSSKEMGQKTKGGSNKNNSKQKRLSVGVLPPERFPDFARFVISSGKNQLLSGLSLHAPYDIADFFELKALNSLELWWTADAKRAAQTLITSSLAQVYDTAMAGFAYNPAWKQVYGIIVAGGYFSFFIWKERPSDHVLRPIFPTKVPKVVKEGASYRRLIGRLLNQEAEYQRRVLPEVLYWNEPVFDYKPDNIYYCRASLSAKFLWTMRYSMKTRFPQFLPRSALFTPPDKKPPMTKGTKVWNDPRSSSRYTYHCYCNYYRPKLRIFSTRL